MAKIYAIANRKGGCAKTTTTGALASGSGRRGFRVLAVDFDPQGNLTQWNGFDASQVDTIYEAMHGECELQDVIQHGEYYDFVPSFDSLALAETDFLTTVGREEILRDVIAQVEGDYDIILIDTPPSLGLLTMMAFVAASDGILVTSDASAFATQGMSKLANYMEAIQRKLNPGAKVIGIIIGRINPQANIHRLYREITADFAEVFDAPVYETTIRASVVIVTCQAMGKDIFDESKLSKAVEDYDKLVDEFLVREGFKEAEHNA